MTCDLVIPNPWVTQREKNNCNYFFQHNYFDFDVLF